MIAHPWLVALATLYAVSVGFVIALGLGITRGTAAMRRMLDAQLDAQREGQI